ncbi:MAG: hypothetical protein J7K54_00990 [Candidatus Aenigmarchaeota archaeon]|nr:hypothetical protein [Candidatus Aenigmarchaeota archaeon]
MKLSESIRKGVLHSVSGLIINKFKFKKRRDTFFFDDIGLDYVKLLEENRHSTKLREISHKWGTMLFKSALPDAVKRLPYNISCNVMVRDTFVNLGYMTDMHIEKHDNRIKLTTKEETNVKKIGKNNLHIGMFMGMSTAFFDSDIEVVSVECNSSGDCIYNFRLLDKKYNPNMKQKETYNKLNDIPHFNGANIKEAIRTGLFSMKNGKIYFRGELITAMENTLFHLFSNEGIMLSSLRKISYNYFSSIVKEASSDDKLKLLKNLLQIMGWGLVKFAVDNNTILMTIDYPPFGLQAEKDNWQFLCEVVCGYLWLINKEFTLKSLKVSGRRLLALYSF